MFESQLAKCLAENYSSGQPYITIDQLPEDIFIEWRHHQTVLHKIAQNLVSAQDDASSEANSVRLLTNSAFDELLFLLQMIGSVNGYLIRRASNFPVIITMFNSMKPNEKESVFLDSLEATKKSKKKALFRMRLEHYLGRLVTVQSTLSEEIIRDELEEARQIRRYITKSTRQNKRREEAKQNGNSITEEAAEEKAIDHNISFLTPVIRCDEYTIPERAQLDFVQADIELLSRIGTISVSKASVGYCKYRNIYFILNSEYKNLRKDGILLCQLMTRNGYLQAKASGDTLKPESVLFQCGYNVSSVENLTSVQRHEILSRVIDNNLYSKTGLLSFLDWLIERNSRSENKNMLLALTKWKTDRQFISSYTGNRQASVQE